MRFRTKARLLSMAAAMPGAELFERCYRRRTALQRSVLIDCAAGIKMINRLQRLAGLNVQSAKVLELGCGCSPVCAVLLSLLGAERIVLTDARPLLELADLDRVLEKFGKRLHLIAEELDAYEPLLDSRWRILRAGKSMEQILDSGRIEYLAPTELDDTGLQAGAYDVVCSRNVLEHVPEFELPGMLAESMRLLRPGGFAYHIVDLSDHFSHRDRSINRLNFLRYSDRRWAALGQNRIFYLNRLRSGQIVQMISEAGMQILHVEQQSDPRDIEFLRSLDLPERFEGMQREELAVHNIHVLAVKPSY
ncbi:MAG: class I SAM-dependent methyltransferase [Candidatus Alcyoniella australis]|nr:class I SAM-dependent methyltransferase [Candidatus Alcyoniella australis]